MKFGKQIQKKQLELPEYAANFVDYKALKRTIKELKNSPAIEYLDSEAGQRSEDDPQVALQLNKETFFFRLDRELDKVNKFYTVKERESEVRLKVLIDKQKQMRQRHPLISRTSTQYIALEQGLREFLNDLNKLQQFIEVNQTAFSKILKKWDKTSRSQVKEQYLSRAVDVQPCFRRDVISTLCDEANTALLDCAAWAEGEGTVYGTEFSAQQIPATPRIEQDETDTDLTEALNRGDVTSLEQLVRRIQNTPNASDRITKAFLSTVAHAPDEGLKVLLDTNLVDLHAQDDINERNCLHKAAMAGRLHLVKVGITGNVDPGQSDAYGRIPLHYACMNGHVNVIPDLVEAEPSSINQKDLDGFTALVHGIVHSNLQCVENILSYSARVDPTEEGEQIPLNLACQYGSIKIVELLLRGTPRIRPDAEGLFPQHLVARFGQDPDIFPCLLQYGANLDEPDKLYGWTPLFHASSEGRVECLQRLISLGVDPRALDEKGLPAQYYATWEGHLECMRLLASVTQRVVSPQRTDLKAAITSRAPPPVSPPPDLIPDLSLPPPIIPTRRYGHNFIESKTTVVISFDDHDFKPVRFYDETKYPAARLTVAPRSSQILPRNILLPIQEEDRHISFETDDLRTFAVDFEVFPTYGKKVVAKGSIPPDVFVNDERGSGRQHLSLLDPRLRSVGQICFKFHVIKPFSGKPLEITPFATYWKATSQSESGPASLVTGSSLSGEYVRLYVQLTSDKVPILASHWKFSRAGLQVPVTGLSQEQLANITVSSLQLKKLKEYPDHASQKDLHEIHLKLSNSYLPLLDVLESLPININIDLHVLYPNHRNGNPWAIPIVNINDYLDSILDPVFQHARKTRTTSRKAMRSIVFTSYNKDVCSALNLKQPNFPVLLCNDLGSTEPAMPQDPGGTPSSSSSGRISTSIKESVRIAKNDNLMGLIVRSQLLERVPALVESIKVAGLVLISDASDRSNLNTGTSAWQGMTEGVDGVFKRGGIMRFRETIEV